MLCAVDFCVPHRARAAPGLGKTLGAVAFDDELYCVFTEDVFCFFDLSTRDTDLKKKLYSETPEYARQLAKLRDLKKKAISTNYFIQISTDISNYDVALRRFTVSLQTNAEMGCAGDAPRSTRRIYFENLATDFQPTAIAPGVAKEVFYLAVPERVALTIEEHSATIRAFVVFTPTKIQDITYRIFSLSAASWCTNTSSLLAVRVSRIVLANLRNGRVFFEQKLQ
jgi:hypothetical protein